MRILGITSVTGDCGIALAEGDETLGYIPLADGRGLSESLLPAIRSLFADTGVSVTSLDGIAVTAGPGSFTGIKVGLAAAKGLAYTLSCRVAGISTLEALAWSAGPRQEFIMPLMNAGRGRIFAGCYHFTGSTLQQRFPDTLTSLPQLYTFIQKPAFLIGDAALQAYDFLSDRNGILVEASPNESWLPLPVAVAQLGLAKISAGHSMSAATLTPFYLQRHEAEILMEKRLSSPADQSCSS